MPTTLFFISATKHLNFGLLQNPSLIKSLTFIETELGSFSNLAKRLKKRFKPNFIIEIGSNDGAFIKNFKKNQVVGVEPCQNLAVITRKKKYKTYSNFWNIDLAKKITKKKKADLI